LTITGSIEGVSFSFRLENRFFMCFHVERTLQVTRFPHVSVVSGPYFLFPAVWCLFFSTPVCSFQADLLSGLREIVT
jgi:hypothetical protein